MTNHPSNPNPSEQGVSSHESAEAGENLRQLVDRVGPLPWALVRWFSLQVSELLEPIHAKGLVHGEISPEAIYLTRPWPNHEVTLGKGNPTSGRAVDDLRQLGEMMEWLLSCGKSQGNPPAGWTPEAGRIIPALVEGSIPDARTLGAMLLDSLSDGKVSPGLPSHTPALLPGKPVSWKIAAAAAVIILVGAGSYFVFKPDTKNTAGRIGESRSQDNETGEADPALNGTANQTQSSVEKAKELEAKELAAKELAAKDLAAKEQAAMEAASEKAAKEKEIQDKALVLKNGKIIEGSEASPEEKEQAFSVLLSLAKEENVNAIELVGASYWQGNGAPKDRESARIWFEKGASLGNARSMLGLGYCYDLAIGGPRDTPKAVEWWTKAANLGYEVAMSRLGDYFYLDPDAIDIKKAMEWWQRAAEAESPSADAMTNLGVIYAKGTGTGKDLQKAVKWLQMAADLGAPEAMTELGIVYFNGEIKGKEADAFPLFLKAAEAGSPRAMNALETCFRNGIGTRKDPTEADRWARLASETQKGAER